ncbi:MAG: DNA-3-methyladenine glycosylase [Calditrichia bacterium]|nr:DNA-3-methyladenine glycosylase [Calditrichota bacterium]
MIALPQQFYAQDTITVAKQLLGKLLVRHLNGEVLAAKIVETEAYIGEDDPACHAARGRTPRTEIMYGPPGFAYIYFIYGMYFCLNAVTEAEGFPAAVLIRAAEPVGGLEQMRRLRRVKNDLQLANGPGKLCQAFDLNRDLNGAPLTQPPLYIADSPAVPSDEIVATSRVGISAGKSHLWRFLIKNNRFASHPNHR